MRKFATGRALRGAVCLTGLLVLGGCGMFSQDDGRYDPAPLTEYKAGMSVRQVWSLSVGSGSGLGFAPAVVNDAVYAATPDGSVGKFDLQSGRQIWKVRAETKQLSAGVGSDGTTTAVASPDGDVIAFDDTGKVKWKARATSDVTIPPVVGYGIVVVRSGDYRIQAFDANSGDRLWRAAARPGPGSAQRRPDGAGRGAGHHRPARRQAHGHRLRQRQRPVGRHRGHAARRQRPGTPDRRGGLARIAGNLLCAVAYQGRIVCFDVTAGGRPIWAKDFSSVSGMSLDERFAYASDQNSVVSAFALDNGGNVWKQAALKNRQLTAPALLGGALAVGDLDGYVHFLSRSDGSLMARLSVGGGAIVSPPQTTSQGVLIQTGNGNLALIGSN